ncbi:MAG: hypothetical protein HY308_00665 [Gammaproteobacteria bacterium]|nr:hypothetical protein [Gammaproteobacteria bacterium]
MQSQVVVSGYGYLTPWSNSLGLAQDGATAPTKNARADDRFEYIPTSWFKRVSGSAVVKHTRLSLLVSTVVEHVLRRAQLQGRTALNERTGLVGASAFGAVDCIDGVRRCLQQRGPAHIDPQEFSKATHNYPVSLASVDFGLRGPLTAFVSGNHAGRDALAFATLLLESAKAERMLVVAYDELCPLVQAVVADRSAHSPTPTAVAESCCCVLLEHREAALVRGMRHYGVLADIGATPAVAVHGRHNELRYVDMLGVTDLYALTLALPDIGDDDDVAPYREAV